MNMDHRFPVLNEGQRKISVRWRPRLKITENNGKHSTGNHSTPLVSVIA